MQKAVDVVEKAPSSYPEVTEPMQQILATVQTLLKVIEVTPL